MSGATAGSGWWERPADGDDANEHATTEAPLDDRTTQPMARIDRSGSPASPTGIAGSSSPDTVRVDAPAWFLRAQKRAAEQNRTDAENDGDDDVETDLDLDGVAAADDRDDARSEAAGDTPSVKAIDPNAVRLDFDDAPLGTTRPPAARSGASDDAPQLLDPTVAASYREPTPPPDLVAGLIGLVGAAMLAIGSFLTWGRSTGVVEATVTGLTGSNGWGTLTCGMVVAFGAALVLTGRRNGLVGGAMLVAALAAVYFCGFSAVDILRTGDELPDILVGVGIDRDVAGAATLELTSGFAVVAVGAGAALVAATIAFARRV